MMADFDLQKANKTYKPNNANEIVVMKYNQSIVLSDISM